MSYGFRMPSSYYDPPEPDPTPLHCMLCGKNTIDEDCDIEFIEVIENTISRTYDDYSAVACPYCGEAGGLVVSYAEPDYDFGSEEEDEYWSSNFAKHGIYLDDN